MMLPEERGEAGRYERERERQAPSRSIFVGEVEIVVAGSAGYCYGVERALQIADEAAQAAAKPIYTLGPIIHNPSVVSRLEEQGIVPVDSLDEIAEGTVIVRTHGVPPDVIAAAEARGLRVVDATCPFVTIAQRKAATLQAEGYVAVILGERDHPEVAGLTACAGDAAVVVDDAGALDVDALVGKRVGVVVQTTQTRENLRAVAAAIAPVARETLIFNTICDATEKRQNAARDLARSVDVVVVVGGRNSANTMRLAALCRDIQPRTHHVESAAEVRGEWFAGGRRIGVTAGASTPDEEIDATVAAIETLVAG
jgi:4-hydroxy-3-methylbut-2-enyl diphosphate reductase